MNNTGYVFEDHWHCADNLLFEDVNKKRSERLLNLSLDETRMRVGSHAILVSCSYCFPNTIMYFIEVKT